ncbi:MAG: hypothetical protein EAY75_10700 [Bacteroidetes bacterium]|nr:MAG: hypothetical protein EAY75_10700 [Bacteroidota bacterium]
MAAAFGQQKERFSLVLQVQPELTLHKNDYAFRWKEKKTLATLNMGINAAVQYNLTPRTSIDVGLGFISRRLNTTVFIDQSLLPPPYYDSTKILHTAKGVAFRTLQIPVGLSYSVVKTKRTNIFLRGAYVPNFLFNTKYEANNCPAFNKNTWQGQSLNLGFGFDYSLTEKIKLTSCLVYSFENTVARDKYTISQDERGIALTHRYLQLSAGGKIKL